MIGDKLYEDKLNYGSEERGKKSETVTITETQILSVFPNLLCKYIGMKKKSNT